MLDESALRFLREHISGFERIPSDSVSALIALPKDSRVQSLEEFQPQPNAIKQTPSFFSCQSFCDYINRFKNEDSTVYLNVDGGKFSAVLDHHGAESPQWGRHKATFEPKLSLEWESWRAIHRKQMTQIDLAHFIEERLDDIVVPEPNTMLKAALDFQANENLALASSVNLDDGGVRFTFQKDNASQNVVFPHRVKIRIPIHENEIPVELEVRVRYKADGNGALRFTCSFVKNPDLVVRSALLTLAAKIRETTENLHHYEGALA